MTRDRGRRAIRQLLAGGWDEPLAALADIFEFEMPWPSSAPTLGRGPLAAVADAVARDDAARDWGARNRLPGLPRLDRISRGPALKFEPVVDEALLRRFNRAHPSCVACGSRDGVAGHHVIYRSVLRLDVEWNLIPLCGRCHLNAYPESFHRLGGPAWLRLNRLRLPRNVLRNLIVVLFVIRPWIQRGGRAGPTFVTR